MNRRRRRWWRRGRGTDDARRHLEQSIAERGRVEQLARELAAHHRRNHLSERVARSLRGEP